MKKIILVGGGTAGHIVPNLALIPLLKNDYEIYYICANTSVDKKYLNNKDIKAIYPLPVVKLERKLSIKNIFIPIRLLRSYIQSKKIIKEIKPDIIFSKGGFVGVPVALASNRCKIPFILHESDYSIGLANKLSQKNACQILTTFSDTVTKYPEKTLCVGTPLRELKANNDVIKEYKALFNNNKKTLFIFGGSQGSLFFNNFFIDNSKQLCEHFNIILITGKQDYKKKKTPSNFVKLKSVSNIQDYYSLCNVVVTRGGANSLFEILKANRPMLIVPLPTSNSRGDQIENAKYFAKNGFAECLLQEQCTYEKFIKKINGVLDKKNEIIAKQKASKFINANETIYSIINKVTSQN